MNWGGFAGGFSQGFSNGAAMGKMYNEASKQDKLDKMRAEGIAEAQAARQAAIDSSVKDMQAKAATGAGNPEKTGQAQPALQAGQYAPDTADVQTQAVMPQTPEMAQQAQAAPPTGQAAPPSATPMAGNMAQSQPAPAAAGGFSGAPKRYNVGGKGFDSLEEARAHADKVLPSMVDYQVKYVMPKMAQGLMEQGRPEEAQKLIDWAGQRTSQRHLEDWNKAVLAFQTDDFDTAAKKLAGLHKDFPDGNDIVTQEPVKDKGGKTVGFNMTIKGEDGKEQKQYVDARQLIEYGLTTLSPDKMFAQMSSRQQSYDTLKAKADYDAQNDDRTMRRDVAKQGMIEDRADKRTAASDARRSADADRQHGYKLEELTTSDELKQIGAGRAEKAKIQAKIDILKENGLPADAIKEMIPHILGGDGYKRATAPEEARRLLMTERIKDPMFNRKTVDQQKAVIEQDMQTIYGAAKPASDKPAVTIVPNPMAPSTPSRPGAAPAASKPKGIPVLDSKTGTIVYR